MEVLFEDNHLIIINKRAGDIVQGDNTGDVPLSEKVKRYIKAKYDKQGNVFVGTIHRLDRPVSGAIVFAKTSKALERMNKMFHDKEVQKTYWALCIDPPKKPHDTLIQYLVKDSKKNRVKAYPKEVPESKKAILTYNYLRKSDRFHLLEVLPLTGRPHQIRVQLSSMGCIIKGDLKYGAPMPNKDKSICLHSRNVAFKHPVTGEMISIDAPLPINHWGKLS